MECVLNRCKYSVNPDREIALHHAVFILVLQKHYFRPKYSIDCARTMMIATTMLNMDGMNEFRGKNWFRNVPTRISWISHLQISWVRGHFIWKCQKDDFFRLELLYSSFVSLESSICGHFIWKCRRIAGLRCLIQKSFISGIHMGMSVDENCENVR